MSLFLLLLKFFLFQKLLLKNLICYTHINTKEKGGNMATRKTASKTSKKATIDFDWQTEKPSKRKRNKAKKELKKLGAVAIVCAVVFLIVGAVGGFFGVKYLIKDDVFVLNGQDEITLELGKTYKDEGAKVIAFGKDESDKVEIETNLKIDDNGNYYADEAATYYMVYKVKNLKYGSIIKVQKIRLITFVEASEGGE